MRAPDPVAKAFVDAAVDLHRRRLWRDLDDTAPFLIRHPDEPHPFAAMILGDDDSGIDLILFRGEHALADLTTPPQGSGDEEFDDDDNDADDPSSALTVRMSPIGDLLPDDRQLLADARFQVGHDGRAPCAMSRPSLRRPRMPTRSELRLLADCARAILAVAAKGELRPKRWNPRRKQIFELVIEPGSHGRDASSHLVPCPRASDASANRPSGARAPKLTELPRTGERWIAGFVDVPPNAPGRHLLGKRLFLVIDAASHDLVILSRVAQEATASEETLAIAQVALEQAFCGQGVRQGAGCPGEIAFVSEDLVAAAGNSLHELGIATSVAREGVDSLREAVEFLAETVGTIPGIKGAAAEKTLPSTLEEWKQADREFLEVTLADVEKFARPPRRAYQRYFGSEALTRDVLRDLDGLQPIAGFMEWYFADYRATSRSKTYFEHLLEDAPLDPVDRILIEARRRCRFSIFRVDFTEPGATLGVEDVLTGERLTVHDQALSGCDLEGLFLVLRVVRLGQWDTCVVCGPPMSAFDFDVALRELRARRVEWRPEGFRRASHVVGRFWAHELDRRRHPRPMQINNTDGDPLRLQTATFRVEDAAVVDAALRQRGDVEFDESARTWFWSRPGGPARGVGKTTLLGRIQMIGEELLLEVNSDSRLARACAWLDQIPGVHLVQTRVQALGEPAVPKDDHDDRAGEPVSNELREKIVEIQRQHYRHWLDTRVPALGNRTPREACATEDGRRLVGVLIRTMPSSTIPGGTLPPPRAELLRELGLEA
jgi:hypothetical protein